MSSGGSSTWSLRSKFSRNQPMYRKKFQLPIQDDIPTQQPSNSLQSKTIPLVSLWHQQHDENGNPLHCCSYFQQLKAQKSQGSNQDCDNFLHSIHNKIQFPNKSGTCFELNKNLSTSSTISNLPFISTWFKVGYSFLSITFHCSHVISPEFRNEKVKYQLD